MGRGSVEVVTASILIRKLSYIFVDCIHLREEGPQELESFEQIWVSVVELGVAVRRSHRQAYQEEYDLCSASLIKLFNNKILHLP